MATENELFVNKDYKYNFTKPNLEDSISKANNALSEIYSAYYFVDIVDCYDNDCKNEYNRAKPAIYSTDLLNTQILDRLMDICYKTKNPLKVLHLLESLLIEQKSPLDL